MQTRANCRGTSRRSSLRSPLYSTACRPCAAAARGTALGERAAGAATRRPAASRFCRSASAATDRWNTRLMEVFGSGPHQSKLNSSNPRPIPATLIIPQFVLCQNARKHSILSAFFFRAGPASPHSASPSLRHRRFHVIGRRPRLARSLSDASNASSKRSLLSEAVAVSSAPVAAHGLVSSAITMRCDPEPGRHRYTGQSYTARFDPSSAP
jgi:hypothetical protein